MKCKSLIVLVAILFGGCATNRGIVDVQVEGAANPDTGIAVKIVKVVDKRKFELAPDKPSTPSLKNDEINTPEITSRAIARKRNGFGKALGDILLPEGRTVSALVEDAVSVSLKKSGYRVLSSGEAGFDKAVPIKVEIEQFWSWFSPGMWAISVEFEADVKLISELKGLEKSPVVHGYTIVKSVAAGTGTWVKTFNQGIQDLIANIVKVLSTQ